MKRLFMLIDSIEFYGDGGMRGDALTGAPITMARASR